MKKQKKSFFITVEGGEGVGKSSFVSKLSQELSDHAIKHLVTREPGGTLIAEKLRDIFNDPNVSEFFTTEAEFLIVSAARAQHVKNVIKPALEAQKLVVCDRFVDSSSVYQGAIGGLPRDFMDHVSSSCLFGVDVDLTFLLDCEPTLALSRVNQRVIADESGQKETRYDKKALDFHRKVREAFCSLAQKEPHRIKVLDSSLEVEELVSRAMLCLRERFLL